MPELKSSIMVVEDDRNFQKAVVDFLAGEGHEVRGVSSGEQALTACSSRPPDVVLLDQKLPDGQGVDFCASILQKCEMAKIIFMTAYPSFDNAVSAIKAGAFDYLTKPVELEELNHVIGKAVRTLELESIEQYLSYQSEKESEQAAIMGESPELDEVRRMADIAGRSEANVLITGETGTGKNLVAKAIHFNGPKRTAPFVSINCAAIPAEMMESELFGHEKGAFTGASQTRKGIFEMAHGGTLFLDEIGAMPLNLQSKLLSVIEDKNIRRLGGQTNHPVEARIIAATNTEPEQAISENKLRQDLFYRLNVIRIHIPPLRQRPDDLPVLCRHFLAELARGRNLKIEEEEIYKLYNYHWPGNIRELKNLVERAVTIQEGPAVTLSCYIRPEAETEEEPAARRPQQSQALAPQINAEPVPLEEMEKKYIQQVLEHFQGNISKTARTLDIAESTLRRKLKSYQQS
ncbi:MAG: sigma-54 dependent transcriptional regulator [bacterium]